MRKRRLNQSAHPVNDHQRVEDKVRTMRDPERPERVTSRELNGVDINQEHVYGQKNASKPWNENENT